MILERLVAQFEIDPSGAARGVQEAQRQATTLNTTMGTVGGTFTKVKEEAAAAGKSIPKSVYDSSRAMTLMHISALQMNQALDRSRLSPELPKSIYDSSRAMTLMHSQALQMNAQFNAGAQSTQRSAMNMGQFGNAVRAAAVQATGMNPIAGRLLGTIGQFAAGTGVMAGVFVGMAGLAALWNKLGEEARKAKEKVQAAQEVAAQPGSLPASITTQEHASALRVRRDAIGQELQEDARRARQQGLTDAPDVIAKETRLRRELADILRDLARLNALSAEQAEEEAEARTDAATAIGTQADELARLNRELARYMQQSRSDLSRMDHPIFGARFGGQMTARGSFLADQRMIGLTTPFSPGAMFGNRSREVFASDNPINQMYERFRLLVPALDKTKSGIEQFGQGAQEAVDGLIDMKTLGANLAGQGISAVLGVVGDALFGPDYVSALEDNTRALRRLSGDTSELEKLLTQIPDAFKDAQQFVSDAIAQQRFGGGLELVRRQLDAGDVTDPTKQFQALQKFLAEQIPGSGFMGLGGLRGQIMQLNPQSAGDFLTRLLESIGNGQFDAAQLGAIGLGDFLDVLSEMESLGDAATGAAEALDRLADSVNQPEGFKLDWYRYTATDRGFGASADMPAGPGRAGNVTFSGPITINTRASDGERVYREFVKEARRQASLGGADDFSAGAAPQEGGPWPS